MEPWIICHFLVKSEGQLVFVVHSHDAILHNGENFCPFGGFCYIGSPDENMRKIRDLPTSFVVTKLPSCLP